MMSNSSKENTHEILQDIKKNLTRGVKDRKHAFHTPVFSNISKKEGICMPLNDQAGFAMAIEDTGFNLFVLPYNWNFRPKWHKIWYGPLKIWHDYEAVPEPILQRNADQAALNAIVDLSILRDD